MRRQFEHKSFIYFVLSFMYSVFPNVRHVFDIVFIWNVRLRITHVVYFWFGERHCHYFSRTKNQVVRRQRFHLKKWLTFGNTLYRLPCAGGILYSVQDNCLSNPENFPEREDLCPSVSLNYQMKAAKERNGLGISFPFFTLFYHFYRKIGTASGLVALSERG